MIACVLLHSAEKEISMKQLLENTSRIYEYMKLKDNYSTLMQVKPEAS